MVISEVPGRAGNASWHIGENVARKSINWGPKSGLRLQKFNYEHKTSDMFIAEQKALFVLNGERCPGRW